MLTGDESAVPFIHIDCLRQIFIRLLTSNISEKYTLSAEIVLKKYIEEMKAKQNAKSISSKLKKLIECFKNI